MGQRSAMTPETPGGAQCVMVNRATAGNNPWQEGRR
jgi:hypothetical protein